MRRYVLVALLATACSSAGGKLVIREKTTLPHQLSMSAGGRDAKWVKVRTDGPDTIIDFRGREFVFKGLRGYEGTLSLEEVDVEIGDADVLIDASNVEVKEKDTRVMLEHAKLQPGRRIIYSAGSIWSE